MGGFESAGAIARRALPKKPRLFEKVCRCGHTKAVHEPHPVIADLGLASGTICLLCDCPLYKFGSRRVRQQG